MKKLLFPTLICLTMIGCQNAKVNPFLSGYDTPFGVPPFEQIENEHYLQAFEEGINRQKKTRITYFQSRITRFLRFKMA